MFGRLQRLRERQRRTRGTRSWSQFGEDLVIDLFMGEGVGTYVDVGAGHPQWGSNTYKFYRRGWQGTLIEPNQQLVRKIHKARPRDQVIEGVILCNGVRELVDFYEFAVWQYSTLDQERARRLQASGLGEFGTRKVRALSLGSLNVRCNPSEPSFLSVDAEGYDLDVLQSVDWDTFRPRVVCVEDASRSLDDVSDIDQILEPLGYRLGAYVGKSCIYAQEEYVF